jgi:hypothetical protein
VKSVEDKKHEHSNKALLDTYTQTEANLADAVTKKHAHANQEELDKIAVGDKAKWDAIEGNIIGTSSDTKTSDTIEGAKKYAADVASTQAEAAKRAVISAVNTDTGLAVSINTNSQTQMKSARISFDDTVTFILDCGGSGVTA